MYLFVAFLLSGFELTFEGLKFRGWHKTSGLIEFFYRAAVTIIIFAFVSGCVFHSKWSMPYTEGTIWHILWTFICFYWKVIAGYLFFRFGFFDPALNLITKQPINYIGTTKWHDISLLFVLKMISKIRMPEWRKGKGWQMTALNFPPEHFIFIRFIFLCWGAGWLLTGNPNQI